MVLELRISGLMKVVKGYHVPVTIIHPPPNGAPNQVSGANKDTIRSMI